VGTSTTAFVGPTRKGPYRIDEDTQETPELLISFMHVLLGLKLAPEMVVLDFGAGSCWSSRYLTQLGMEVIAMDASPSALEIGRRLYNKGFAAANDVGDAIPRAGLGLPAHAVEAIIAGLAGAVRATARATAVPLHR